VGALGWSVAGVLVALLLLRAVHLDERSALLLAASTGLPVVLALAWPLLLVAAVTGRLTLAVVAALLALVDAALLGPLLTAGRGPGPGGMPVRLLHLNVQYDVDAGASVATQVGRSEADVVVLTELSALSLRHLRLPQYAHAAVHERDDGFGGGIWSRWPLDDVTPVTLTGRTSLRADVVLPGGARLRVHQVHLCSPMSRADRRRWVAQHAELAAAMSAHPGPQVVAGDFNSARSDRAFAALLGGPAGVADAADGRGLLPTWPSGWHVVPPVLRLDHVLVSRDVGVRSVRVLGHAGPDHRAVVADLVVAGS